jgi:hypothetical protein
MILCGFASDFLMGIDDFGVWMGVGDSWNVV